MAQEQSTIAANRRRKPGTGIIDCDVHVAPTSNDEIKKYMRQPFRDAFRFFGRGIFDNPFTVVRPDAIPPSGGPIGSDPEFLREQLIDAYGIEYAILHPWIYADYYADPDLKAEICSAYNQWLYDTWLTKYNHDGVFKGSIVISHHDPSLAVKEIEKWADNPHFIEVIADAGARMPFGQRHYWPIYEACEKFGLPFAYHPGSDGLGSNTPFVPGFPSRFIEWMTLLPNEFMAHLVSFITEGVFERFPGFKIVSLEGGFHWLPSVMWRLDAEYKSFRFEVPWLKKLPSLYLRDHVRFGSQPFHRPESDQQLLQLLEIADAEHLLMYSSDYPHFDTDAPVEILPRNISEHTKNRIFYQNAKEFYNL